MDLAILADLDINMFFYALPLVVVLSLVYAATRHEAMGPILQHALRVGAYVVGFMCVVLAILWFISLWTGS